LLFINPYFQIGKWGSTSAEQGSAFLEGLVVAITLVGCAIGSSGSWLSNTYGRRKTLLSAALLFIVGGGIMFFAPHVSVLVIGRFVVGLAIGKHSVHKRVMTD
jgi:MFS family permease